MVIVGLVLLGFGTAMIFIPAIPQMMIIGFLYIHIQIIFKNL